MAYIVKGNNTVGTPTEAHKILYDNANANIDSGTVGGAIDELSSNLTDLIINKTFTVDDITIPANGSSNILFENTSIDGYTVIMRTVTIRSASSGGQNYTYCFASNTYGVTGGTSSTIRNTNSTSSAKVRAILSAIYKKDTFMT